MMRPIKFRAWIISQKEYIYFEDGEFLEWCGSRWRIVWESDPSAGINGGFIPQEDFVLEQFTGLHDKNGKEIWEGDVVKAPLCGNFKIEFHSDRWRAVSVYNTISFDDMAWWRDVEVLGNIYSNPDLLNKEKA